MCVCGTEKEQEAEEEVEEGVLGGGRGVRGWVEIRVVWLGSVVTVVRRGN